MSAAPLLSGVLAPVVTPFRPDLSPDGKRLIAHCRWLLERHCGLAVFGTNSEANSLSVEERIELLDLLLDAGLDPKRMMPGTGCCARDRNFDTLTTTWVGGVVEIPELECGTARGGMPASHNESFDRYRLVLSEESRRKSRQTSIAKTTVLCIKRMASSGDVEVLGLRWLCSVDAQRFCV